MSFLCCNHKNNCLFSAVVASIIIGIIAAVLRFTAVITVTPAFLWVVFGIAIVYLAITSIISAVVRSGGTRGCICSILPVLLTGILGTVLTSVVLLAIEFVATSVIGAIITGALLTFFSLTLTSVACLSKCVARCSDSTALEHLKN